MSKSVRQFFRDVRVYGNVDRRVEQLQTREGNKRRLMVDRICTLLDMDEDISVGFDTYLRQTADDRIRKMHRVWRVT